MYVCVCVFAVRSSDGALGGVPIHFVLLFPSTYPAEPPQVRLFQPVPHPNVRRVAGAVAGGMAGGVPASARWRLGLWDCVPDKNTWSAAYSVLSVLVQLQGTCHVHTHTRAHTVCTVLSVPLAWYT